MAAHLPARPRGVAGSMAAAVTLLLASAVLAGCGATGRSTGAAGSGEYQQVTVRASEFRFESSTIRVPAGKPVRLTLANGGVIEHDLVIEQLPARAIRTAATGGHGHADQVAAHAAAGKQASVEFTPTTPGTYEILCTVAGHKEAGMRGTLVVE